MTDQGNRNEPMSTKRTRTDVQRASGDECIFVVGGGPVGYAIATRLSGGDRDVHLLDRSRHGDLPDGVTADEIPSLDSETLAAAETDRATAVVVAGRNDAENLLVTQLARSRFGVDRLVTVVNDPRRLSAFEPLNVDLVDAATVIGRTVTERW